MKVANNFALTIRHTVVLIIASFLFVGIASAQGGRDPQRGYQAGNSFSISDIENVNLSNGNMILNIPLASIPGGRGTAPGFTVGLKYNSKLYNSVQELRHDGLPSETGDHKYMRDLVEMQSGGWNLDSGGYILQVKSRFNTEQMAQCIEGNALEYQRNAYAFKIELQTPSGEVKELRPYGYTADYVDAHNDGWFKISPDGRSHSYVYGSNGFGIPECTYTTQQVATGMTYFTTDGSGIRLFVPYTGVIGTGPVHLKPWTLYMPDGSILENRPSDDPTVLQRITDRNGNRLFRREGTYQGMSGVRIENEVGHFIFVGNEANGDTKIIRKGFDGHDVVTTIRWKTYWVHRNYRATQATNANPNERFVDLLQSLDVIDKITLPAELGALTYEFDYHASPTMPSAGQYTNGWGELKSIKLPSGATADYVFQLDNVNQVLSSSDVVGNAILSRTLSYDGHSAGDPRITETTTYGTGFGSSSVVNHDGTSTSEFSDSSGPLRGYAYRTISSTGAITDKIWMNNPAPRVWANEAPVNAFVKTELTTVPNSLGQPWLTAIKDFEYDKNGNVLEVREYDWVPYSSITRSGSGMAEKVTAIPSNLVLKRKTVNTYYNQAPHFSDTTTDSPNIYANPLSPRLRNLVKTTEVRDSNDTVVSKSEFYYDNPNTTGNLIETRVWDSTKGVVTTPLTAANAVISTTQYNSYGAPVVSTDPRGTQTTLTYGCIDGAASCPANLENLYPTKTETASNFSSLKRTSLAKYDFFTGLVTEATDADNNVTSKTLYDALGRPTRVMSAFGTPSEAWTETTYDDLNRRVIVRSDLFAKGDGRKVATQFYDQLGRVRLAKTLEDAATQSATNETDGIKVETRYKTVNGFNYQLTSNPFRAATAAAETDPTMGWTLSTAWTTGRRSEVETFSGAALPAVFGGNNTNSSGVVRTDIDADRTLVTDQAGKRRISRTNALGQLIDVWEVMTAADSATESITFPGSGVAHAYRTSYGYDTLNNLTTVNQGAQTRTFTYSSLSRLLSATNPESGTIQYAYDPAGNLTQKTDARGVVTTYAYDALSRVTSRSYSTPNGMPANYAVTPNVTYTYDDPAIPNSKGKLTKVSATLAGTVTSETRYQAFDILGRVTQSQQWVDGVAYGDPMTYTYNLSGAMTEQTYPSGRVVRNILNDDGDLAIVRSKKNAASGFVDYARNFTYTAAGAVASMQLGNGRWESTTFNSRLQPTQIALGTVKDATDRLKLNFTYNTAGQNDNNGNVLSQTITVPTETINNQSFAGFTAVQTYSYDSLNRIKDAKEMIGQTQQWKQTFEYDRYGNRRFDTNNNNTTTIAPGCPTEVCNPQVDPSTNKLIGYQFDASGNTKLDAENRTFIYDGENKQVEVKDSNGATIGKYAYNGDGQRIKKLSATEATIFIYNAGGQLVAEYATQITHPADAKVSYLTNDHLGSPRVNTDSFGNVTARHDYQPFGEEIERGSYGSDSVRSRFTGYHRDVEIALYFSINRQFSGIIGRFSQPDPYNILFEKEKGEDQREKQNIFEEYAFQTQNWNKYVYSLNNPLKFVDPDGRNPKISVINIFIGLDKGEESKEFKAALDKLQVEAKEKGITLNIYRDTDGTSSKELFIKSLETKGTATIFVGHSINHDGIQFGATSGNLMTGEVDNKVVKTTIMAVFSCARGAVFDSLTSNNGTISVYTNPGTGYLNTTTLSNLGAAETLTANLVRGNGDLQDAIKWTNVAFRRIGNVPNQATDARIDSRVLPRPQAPPRRRRR